jgi:hypothetical protein
MDDLTIKIQAYIEGKLSGTDLESFESELSKNEDLQMMVEGYKILQNETNDPGKWLQDLGEALRAKIKK